jgi:hypothetical protein
VTNDDDDDDDDDGRVKNGGKMSSETINRVYSQNIHCILQHNNVPANKIFSKVNPCVIIRKYLLIKSTLILSSRFIIRLRKRSKGFTRNIAVKILQPYAKF